MATITEDFVSFETAKLLKEKGFDEPTLAYTYGQDMVAYYSQPRVTDNYNVEAGRYPLPTLQMAMKWLREVHNLHITIDLVLTNMYKVEVTDISSAILKAETNSDYTSYEDAVEDAIRYCLENLI